MSPERLSMRRIRELLRPKYEFGWSHREIAASPGIANNTVSDYVGRAAVSRTVLAVAGGARRRRAHRPTTSREHYIMSCVVYVPS